MYATTNATGHNYIIIALQRMEKKKLIQNTYK